MEPTRRSIFVEPSHEPFLKDRLFSADDPALNRDDQLSPLRRLRSSLGREGAKVHTIDLWDGRERGEYYSLGQIRFLPHVIRSEKLARRAYCFLEPPTNAGWFYRRLPMLTKEFERVFIFNVEGDGYSLRHVNQARLRPIRFPQPFLGVLKDQWARQDRLNKLVIINSNKRPWDRGSELYSERIRAIAELRKHAAVDLFGFGWKRILLGHRRTLKQFFWPQLRHYRSLQKAYRGPVNSKYDVLSRYQFALCLENCKMKGYITEKLFDCLYTGTVPIYLGAPDIEHFVPKEAFIDARQFSSWTQAWEHCQGLSRAQVREYRDAGRAFLESDNFRPFYDGWLDVFAE